MKKEKITNPQKCPNCGSKKLRQFIEIEKRVVINQEGYRQFGRRIYSQCPNNIYCFNCFKGIDIVKGKLILNGEEYFTVKE